MQYKPLVSTNSTPRSSITTIDPIVNIQFAPDDYLCRVCKNKLIRKQETTHTPIQCLSQRCELLENEIIRLRDHDMKSQLQIKELEIKIISLEDTIPGLTTPKEKQATPFNFGSGHKHRHQLKKTQSQDTSGINYDNILQPRRSNSRERVGLFGSLGASSQYH
jgi:hypothetical protein